MTCPKDRVRAAGFDGLGLRVRSLRFGIEELGV